MSLALRIRRQRLSSGGGGYASKYLTLVAREDTTFRVRGSAVSNRMPQILWSTDGGDSWDRTNPGTNGSTMATVSAGQEVMIKSNKFNNTNYFTISSSGNFDVYGNAMSMVFGTDAQV